MRHRIPWKVIGVFYCCQGGPVELCKNILRECITEYDDAVAAGLEDTLHRVAIRLLSPSRIVGQQLRDWLVSDTPLISFAHAFCCLLQYAMVSLVERCIESAHVIIRRVGLSAVNVLVPYVCAKVREEANVSLLRADIAFNKF